MEPSSSVADRNSLQDINNSDFGKTAVIAVTPVTKDAQSHIGDSNRPSVLEVLNKGVGIVESSLQSDRDVEGRTKDKSAELPDLKI